MVESGMTGAFLNAIGILIGALFGLAQCTPLSLSTQDFFRRALGAGTVFFGGRLVWLGVNGTLWPCLKQIFIAMLAVSLGHAIGHFLNFQRMSNYLGKNAGKLITSAQIKSGTSRPATDGLAACTILFCAAPLGLIGAVTDGLADDFYLLGVKAVMDGLAMTGFVKVFGWPAAFSAFPVYGFLGVITFACQVYGRPFLDAHGLTNSVNVTAGMVAGAVAVVILGVRKVELANFLPALVLAPVFTRLLS
jgi:uncharacterized membrane protein YqgA involved in biofilm formation